MRRLVKRLAHDIRVVYLIDDPFYGVRLDIAIEEGGQLRLGQGTDLGGLDRAALE